MTGFLGNYDIRSLLQLQMTECIPTVISLDVAQRRPSQELEVDQIVGIYLGIVSLPETNSKSPMKIPNVFLVNTIKIR